MRNRTNCWILYFNVSKFQRIAILRLCHLKEISSPPKQARLRTHCLMSNFRPFTNNGFSMYFCATFTFGNFAVCYKKPISDDYVKTYVSRLKECESFLMRLATFTWSVSQCLLADFDCFFNSTTRHLQTNSNDPSIKFLKEQKGWTCNSVVKLPDVDCIVRNSITL